MELEQARKQVTVLIVNNLHFENFLACAQVTKKDLYAVEFEFLMKVVDFVGIFKIQVYMVKGKHRQSKMKEIKGMVEDIIVF